MSKPVIYSVGRDLDWLKVADRLKASLGWMPVYWVTQKPSHETFKEHNPGCVCHLGLDLNRGLAEDGASPLRSRALSEKELRSLDADLPIMMELIDRIDLGKRFAYGERRRLVLQLAMHWLSVFEELQPEKLIFNVPPHSIGEYVLYCVARMNGVDIRIFRPTAVNNHHIIVEDIERLPATLRDAYERKLSAEVEAPVSEAVAAEIEGILTAGDGFRPGYLVAESERNEKRETIREKMGPYVLSGKVKYSELLIGQEVSLGAGQKPLVKRPARENDGQEMRQAFKRPNLPLSGPVLSRWEYRTYRDWAMAEKIRIEARYAEMCAKDIPDDPYIYFGMHYQPERTSCPDGGIFSDHFLAISLVSRAMPDDWKLAVKEHPSQFNFNGFGELSRWEEYYDGIAALPNVVFLPTGMSSVQLIDRAKGVATIAGAVGWEALVRGKPVICFGGAWYGACRGAYRASDADDVRRAVRAMESGSSHTLQQVVAYAAALEEVGRVCYTNTSVARYVDQGGEMQGEILAMLLEEYEGIRAT